MKKLFISLIFFIFLINFAQASKFPALISFENLSDSCENGQRLWICDKDSNNLFDELIIDDCDRKMTYFSLIDSVSVPIQSGMFAILVEGSSKSNNFKFLINDRINNKLIAQLYYDSLLEKAIIKDYSNTYISEEYNKPNKSNFEVNYDDKNSIITVYSRIGLVNIAVIYDITGKQVFFKRNTARSEVTILNTTNLRLGLYFLKIVTDKEIFFQKIVIGI